MNFFNNNGQMNASNFKDAIQQLAKFAAVMDDNSPSTNSLANFSDAAKDELVSRAILTQDGKVALAQAMASPINS